MVFGLSFPLPLFFGENVQKNTRILVSFTPEGREHFWAFGPTSKSPPHVLGIGEQGGNLDQIPLMEEAGVFKFTEGSETIEILRELPARSAPGPDRRI